MFGFVICKVGWDEKQSEISYECERQNEDSPTRVTTISYKRRFRL